jgi:hypothetical protein
VGFYKLLSQAPVSVRTKVRSAPTIARSLGSGGAAATGSIGVGGATTSSADACISSCFLEVSIENAMREESLLLSSVKFSPLPGVRAQDPVAHLVDVAGPSSGGAGGSRGHFNPFGPPDGGAGGSDGGDAPPGGKQRARGARSGDGGGAAEANGGGGGGEAEANSGSDTGAQHDVSRERRTSRSSGGGGATAADEPPPSPKVLASLTPLWPGGNRHFLWAVHRDVGRPPPTAAPGQPSTAGCLGRLEILWRSADGRNGRLQTQPIAGAAAAGPAAALGAPAGGGGGSGLLLELQRLPATLKVDAPFSVGLCVRAAAGAEGRAPAGPLLLLHSAPVSGAGGAGGGSGSGTRPMQQPWPARASDAGARLGGASAAAAAPPAVTVLGPRVVRLGELPPGSCRDVELQLLPLRRGWQRLPAFVVVAADGAPCASVHDVSVLVE